MSHPLTVDDQLRDTRREFEGLSSQLAHTLEDLRCAETAHQDHVQRIQTESQRQLSQLQANLDLQVSRLKEDLADARQARDHWRNVAESSESVSSGLQASNGRKSVAVDASSLSSMVPQAKEVELLERVEGMERELKGCLRKIVSTEDEKQVLRNELATSKDECGALRKQTEQLLSSRQVLQGSLDHTSRILAERTKQVKSLEDHKTSLTDMLEVERLKRRDVEVTLKEVQREAEENGLIAKEKQEKLWAEYQLLQTNANVLAVFVNERHRRDARPLHQLEHSQQSEDHPMRDGEGEVERKKETNGLFSEVEGSNARVEQTSIPVYGSQTSMKRKAPHDDTNKVLDMSLANPHQQSPQATTTTSNQIKSSPTLPSPISSSKTAAPALPSSSSTASPRSSHMELPNKRPRLAKVTTPNRSNPPPSTSNEKDFRLGVNKQAEPASSSSTSTNNADLELSTSERGTGVGTNTYTSPARSGRGSRELQPSPSKLSLILASIPRRTSPSGPSKPRSPDVVEGSANGTESAMATRERNGRECSAPTNDQKLVPADTSNDDTKPFISDSQNFTSTADSRISCLRSFVVDILSSTCHPVVLNLPTATGTSRPSRSNSKPCCSVGSGCAILHRIGPPAASESPSRKRRKLVLANPLYQPWLPKQPGAPGALISSMIELAEMEENKEECVALWVVKPRRIEGEREEADNGEDETEGKEKTRGVYFGEYRVKKDERWLSAEEFCALSEECQKESVRCIRECRNEVRYIMLRAFEDMKQRDVEITMEGLIAEVERISGSSFLKDKGKGKDRQKDEEKEGCQSEADMVRALRDGDVSLDVLTLECTGYDYGIIDELREDGIIVDPCRDIARRPPLIAPAAASGMHKPSQSLDIIPYIPTRDPSASSLGPTNLSLRRRPFKIIPFVPPPTPELVSSSEYRKDDDSMQADKALGGDGDEDEDVPGPRRRSSRRSVRAVEPGAYERFFKRQSISCGCKTESQAIEVEDSDG